MPVSRMARASFSALKRVTRCSVAPARSPHISAETRPNECEIGSAWKMTSSRSSTCCCIDARVTKSRLACVSITPLGAPVLPLV